MAVRHRVGDFNEYCPKLRGIFYQTVKQKLRIMNRAIMWVVEVVSIIIGLLISSSSCSSSTSSLIRPIFIIIIFLMDDRTARLA